MHLDLFVSLKNNSAICFISWEREWFLQLITQRLLKQFSVSQIRERFGRCEKLRRI